MGTKFWKWILNMGSKWKEHKVGSGPVHQHGLTKQRFSIQFQLDGSGRALAAGYLKSDGNATTALVYGKGRYCGERAAQLFIHSK